MPCGISSSVKEVQMHCQQAHRRDAKAEWGWDSHIQARTTSWIIPPIACGIPGPRTGEIRRAERASGAYCGKWQRADQHGSNCSDGRALRGCFPNIAAAPLPRRSGAYALAHRSESARTRLPSLAQGCGEGSIFASEMEKAASQRRARPGRQGSPSPSAGVAWRGPCGAEKDFIS